MNMGMNNQGLAVGGQAIHQHGGGVYGLGAGQMMPPVAAGQPQMVRTYSDGSWSERVKHLAFELGRAALIRSS